MIGAAYIGSQRANSRVLLSTTTMEYPTTSYTIPSGAVYIEADMYGGGAGGTAGFYSPGGRGGAAVIQGGEGGGGGARVQHRHVASMTFGDLINVTLGGSQIPGGVGFQSRLDTQTRSGTTIFTFSPLPTAMGGFGRSGGEGSNGNLSNQNGNAAAASTSSATVAQNGTDGANPAGGAFTTKGLGGLHATNTNATAGTTPGGGGGGGYAKVGSTSQGANGGGGRITMKAYG